MSLIKRNRKLIDEEDVFSQNAWDDFEWTQDMLMAAKARIDEQMNEAKSKDEVTKVEFDVGNMWNSFYQTHKDKFFKDRRWIVSEFGEIIPLLDDSRRKVDLFEVGCGVGNSVVQFLDINKNSNLTIYCCDLSENAIETLKTRDFYKSSKNVTINAFQANIYEDFSTKVSQIIQNDSLDVITLIFTLSALKPDDMQDVIINLAGLLKPGGIIFFRDYAMYDLTQLRFKGNSMLGNNYYVRSDGTTSFFFTKELVAKLFETAKLEKLELKDDNRLLVNRLKSLKMSRCWIQAKYRKPIDV